MTAAEKIFYTVDSSKPNMGLQTFKGERPKISDVTIAKNYCNESELKLLNQIVSAYLDVAELQAIGRIPMYMKDWIETLDAFLKMTRRSIQTTAGSISHDAAEKKAKEEYQKFNVKFSKEMSSTDKDFFSFVEAEVKKIDGKDSVDEE